VSSGFRELLANYLTTEGYISIITYFPLGVTGISIMSSITYTPQGSMSCDLLSGIGLNLGAACPHMLVQHDVKAHIIPITAINPNTIKQPALFMIVIYFFSSHCNQCFTYFY